MHPTDKALVSEALYARAHQQRRAATLLAAKIAVDRAGGADVRSSAVKVVDMLAASERLEHLANAVDGDLLVLADGNPQPAAHLTAPADTIDPDDALDARPDDDQPVPFTVPADDPADTDDSVVRETFDGHEILAVDDGALDAQAVTMVDEAIAAAFEESPA